MSFCGSYVLSGGKKRMHAVSIVLMMEGQVVEGVTMKWLPTSRGFGGSKTHTHGATQNEDSKNSTAEWFWTQYRNLRGSAKTEEKADPANLQDQALENLKKVYPKQKKDPKPEKPQNQPTQAPNQKPKDEPPPYDLMRESAAGYGNLAFRGLDGSVMVPGPTKYRPRSKKQSLTGI